MARKMNRRLRLALSQRMNAVRQRRREKGECPECGDPLQPDDLGLFKLCRECRKRKNRPMVKHLRRLRAKLANKNGFCGMCLVRESVPGRWKCAVCSELSDDWLARARTEARRKGVCPQCLKNPVTRGVNHFGKPYSSCEDCRAKQNDAARKRRAKKRGRKIAAAA